MGLVNLHIVVNELSEILVGSDHICEKTAPASEHRQRAYHIVGLIARLFYNSYIISLGDALDVGHSLANILGSLFAPGFILRIDLVSESATLRVEADGNMRGIFALEQVLKRIDEAKNRRRIEFLRSVARSAYQCIISSKNQGISIEQNQFVSFHIAGVESGLKN